MYMNKQTRKDLADATLALKVYSKNHGVSGHGYDEIWNDAEACHQAIRIMLGIDVDDAIDMLRSLYRHEKHSRRYTQAERWLYRLDIDPIKAED